MAQEAEALDLVNKLAAPMFGARADEHSMLARVFVRAAFRSQHFQRTTSQDWKGPIGRAVPYAAMWLAEHVISYNDERSCYDVDDFLRRAQMPHDLANAFKYGIGLLTVILGGGEAVFKDFIPKVARLYAAMAAKAKVKREKRDDVTTALVRWSGVLEDMTLMVLTSKADCVDSLEMGETEAFELMRATENAARRKYKVGVDSRFLDDGYAKFVQEARGEDARHRELSNFERFILSVLKADGKAANATTLSLCEAVSELMPQA